MKKITLSLIAAALALSACAPGTDSITPASMGNAYANVDCQQAANELVAERTNLAALTKAQQSARVGDAIGVFFVLVPVSSLTGGNKAGDIATSKGKILALETRVASCR